MHAAQEIKTCDETRRAHEVEVVGLLLFGILRAIITGLLLVRMLMQMLTWTPPQWQCQCGQERKKFVVVVEGVDIIVARILLLLLVYVVRPLLTLVE